MSSDLRVFGLFSLQSPFIPDDVRVTGYGYDVNSGALAPVE